MRGHTNWIDTFIDYTDKMESPIRFQQWVAISAIASALGRRCFIDRDGYFCTYPNLYILIVGESAHVRKSSAAELIINILRTTDQFNILTSKASTEGILMELAQTATVDNSLLIFATELATMLNAAAIQGGKVDMLTELYTCPAYSDYKTKTAGVYKLRNVCINFLGCTTLNWMSDNMPGSSIEGGFVGRVIFVVAEQTRLRNLLIKTKETPKSIEIRKIKDMLRLGLTKDISRVLQLHGEFIFDTDAALLLDSWYQQLPQTMKLDPRLVGHYGRLDDIVMKVSMVLRAAEFDCIRPSDLILNVYHVEKAIKMITELEDLMMLAYRGAAFSKTSKDNDRIMRQLEKGGGKMDHSRLLRNNNHYLNAEEFRRVMVTLEESKMIEKGYIGKRIVYKLIKRR